VVTLTAMSRMEAGGTSKKRSGGAAGVGGQSPNVKKIQTLEPGFKEKRSCGLDASPLHPGRKRQKNMVQAKKWARQRGTAKIFLAIQKTGQAPRPRQKRRRGAQRGRGEKKKKQNKTTNPDIGKRKKCADPIQKSTTENPRRKRT